LTRAIAQGAKLKFVANRNSFPANLLEVGVYAPPDLIVSNKPLEIVDVCQSLMPTAGSAIVLPTHRLCFILVYKDMRTGCCLALSPWIH